MTTRRCAKCEVDLSMAKFYKRSSGSIANNQCKACYRDTMLAYQRLRRGEESDEEVSAMYIAINPKIPGELKVGRARDPLKRTASMSNCQNFHLQVIATFPDIGYLESAVHRILAGYRVRDCPGREWFACSLEVATAAVMQARAAE